MPSTPLLERDFATYGELARENARDRGGHPALVHDGRTLNHGELDALMDRVAAALQRDGVAPREVIAICAATSLDYAALFLGALRAGVAVAPLAPSSTAGSLAGMLANAQARIVFVDAETAARLAPLQERIAAPFVALEGEAFETWLAPPGARPAFVDIEPDAPFNLIYSSGTTGTPKGIVQPHRMRWGHVVRARAHGYGPDAITLVSTPLYSNTTLVSFFPAVMLGGTAVLMARFDAGRYLDLAERHRVTHAMLVPVQYRRLMAHPDFDGHDLSSFRMKFCTSAPFAAELKAEVLRRWPGGLIEYYGLTEGGGTLVLKAHERPDKLATVGQPAPGHDIRLIDDAGREVGPGEIGEVVGRSELMMTGYHRQPDKTVEAEWFAPDGRRFIRTGDIGRFDAEGFLTLVDRKKDMIISGGFNIYPSDLEAVLACHPAVLEAAVVGVPSAQWGETPVAYVVPRPEAGERAPSEEALREWANARLGKTQRLAALHFLDSLPRSAIGKVLKRELRERPRQEGEEWVRGR
jgi:acyl-CoA synthetase (AMP-forming)/AMP-acid ligase II